MIEFLFSTQPKSCLIKVYCQNASYSVELWGNLSGIGFSLQKGAVKEIPLLFTFINERNYIAKTFNVTIRFELGIFFYFLQTFWCYQFSNHTAIIELTS